MRRTVRSPDLALQFGRRIRGHRERLGLTQEALALRAGINRTFVGQIERGETTPTLLTIVRFARLLDVDPGELVAGLHE